VTLVDRASEFLERRISRRSFINRSAYVGSAVVVGGTAFALEPGTAYAQICGCGNMDCDCSSTCCSGFSEFCCVLNGGYNYCPANTVIGGWWKADGSPYCNGPRYYLDCSATCGCLDGCSDGFPFCDTDCDGVNCDCALGNCDGYLNACLQFRYGQCNQQIACMGRIVCRIVSCIPPWEVDPTCTTTPAEDDGTAFMNRDCNTAVPMGPPPIPKGIPPDMITSLIVNGLPQIFYISNTGTVIQLSVASVNGTEQWVSTPINVEAGAPPAALPS
jgi:hypothetical protein